MTISNEINGGRGVMISEKADFDLEGRCSIQLSYRRRQNEVSLRHASPQARCRSSMAEMSQHLINYQRREIGEAGHVGDLK